MPDIWPFDLPPDAKAVTSREIGAGKAPILYARRDDDGQWQFSGKLPPPPNRRVLLELGQVVKLDASVLELADLQAGQHAWRTGVEDAWKRRAKEQGGEAGRVSVTTSPESEAPLEARRSGAPVSPLRVIGWLAALALIAWALLVFALLQSTSGDPRMGYLALLVGGAWTMIWPLPLVIPAGFLLVEYRWRRRLALGMAPHLVAIAITLLVAGWWANGGRSSASERNPQIASGRAHALNNSISREEDCRGGQSPDFIEGCRQYARELRNCMGYYGRLHCVPRP